MAGLGKFDAQDHQGFGGSGSILLLRYSGGKGDGDRPAFQSAIPGILRRTRDKGRMAWSGREERPLEFQLLWRRWCIRRMIRRPGKRQSSSCRL